MLAFLKIRVIFEARLFLVTGAPAATAAAVGEDLITWLPGLLAPPLPRLPLVPPPLVSLSLESSGPEGVWPGPDGTCPVGDWEVQPRGADDMEPSDSMLVPCRT